MAWRGDTEGHRRAALLGWAHRRTTSIFKKIGGEYRYQDQKMFLRPKEREAVETYRSHRQEVFLRARDRHDALSERLREAERKGKPTKQLSKSIFAHRRKFG